MKKNLMAIFAVLLLVVAAVPMVFAQNNQNNSTDSAQRTVTVKEMYQTSVQNYEQSREQYRLAVNQYQSAKQNLNFALTKERARTFNDAEETPQLMSNTRNFLGSALQKGVSNLEVSKEWVAKQDIDEATKAQITERINEKIKKLASLNRSVSSVENKEDAKRVALQIREEWALSKDSLKQGLGLAMQKRTEAVMDKMNSLSERLQLKVTQLQKNGKDVSKLQSLVDEFDQKMTMANERHQVARQNFEKMRNGQDSDSLFKNGKDSLSQAQQYMREAHLVLKDIVQELRVQNGIAGDVQ